MYIDSDVKRKESPILSMNQTIPFHPKFSIHYESPFNYGSDSTLFFNIWFWKSPKRNVAIFHSSPSTSSALSPVLFAMQGTVMSKHGNGNRKISLFLGIVHSKRSKSAGAGATASNIELRGIPFINAIDVREWAHVAIIFNRDLLTLYVNGKRGEVFNINKLNLPKIANGPKYETLPIYREIVLEGSRIKTALLVCSRKELLTPDGGHRMSTSPAMLKPTCWKRYQIGFLPSLKLIRNIG